MSSNYMNLLNWLAHERLSSCDVPFFYLGVDYFGPILIRFKKQSRLALVTVKRSGALLTCMPTHAIQHELAGDVSTDNFVLALRRFKCRRGHPRQIPSNNSTNFVVAETEMRDVSKRTKSR